jgi:hypothetical protein
MKLINGFWQWLGKPTYVARGHVVACWISGILVGVIVTGASQ